MTKWLGMVLGVALLLLPMGAQAEETLTGKKIYEIDLDITGSTDYGVTMDAIMSGKAKVPLQGAQFDVAFVGTSKGVLAGKVHGVDYLVMRADGRTDLNVHATIETEDGQRIAAHIGGVASPRQNEQVIDLHENIRLITASEKYSWVNSRQVWGVGAVNLATGKAHIEAYMQQ
jgi:Protein of unknown function (DUF3237)